LRSVKDSGWMKATAVSAGRRIPQNARDADSRIEMTLLSQIPDSPALRDSEERLRLALQAGGSGVWDWDMSRDVAAVSPSYRALFGIPPGTPVTYESWLSYLHPDDLERCRRYGEAFFSGSETDWRLEFRIVTPHRGVRWHRAIGRVYRDAQGKPLRFIGVSTDVTEEERALAALRESEERFRAMADGLPLIIWVHDAEGNQQFVNRTFLEFFGVAEAEMKGGRWQVLMHPEDGPAYAKEFMECVRKRTPFHGEVRVRNASGEWRTVESWARPRWSATGEFLGMVGTSADVTERRQIEQALRDSDRRKDEFLAMLGHELRNPLAVIALAMDMLRLQLPAGSPLHDVREAAQRQTRILIRLVDDLLDSARISTGKLTLRRARLSVHEVVRVALETSRPDLQAHHHHLVVEEPAEELEIEGDEVRLVQVIANLLNNAARYTPDGGRITVCVEREDGQALIRVGDNGIGIAADKIGSLFDLFVQGSGAARDRGAGLGLGLSLVKQLVGLHGGTVKAHSEGPGKGAEFTVRLPLVVGKAQSDAPAYSGPARAPMRRVLVVDDNADARESLAGLLQLLGHDVRVAFDGASGVRMVREFKPHVVLLDIGLPDMDGYEVAKQIRALPEGGEPKIVAASGYGESPEAVQAAGMNAYLVKPIDIAKLESLLQPDLAGQEMAVGARHGALP
jgi:PAS domain S-box-containing protein